MDALASRVGRLEAQLDASRRDVAALQSALAALATDGIDKRDGAEAVRRLASTPRGSGATPTGTPRGGGSTQDAAVAEWVRLFEQELEALRRRTEGRDGPIAALDVRVRRLEGFFHESGAERSAVELADIVLGGLYDLQEQVHALAALPASENSLFGSGGAIAGSERIGASSGAPPLALGLFSKQAQNRLGQLEENTANYENRILALETVTQAHHLEERIEVMEGELLQLDPLKRYAISLRTLEEVSSKVDEVQKAIGTIPYDHIMKQIQVGGGQGGIEGAARDASGKLSAFDAYRVQAGLEQVMVAMEALTRQRNDDIRLVNEQLTQVYTHVERELPRDSASGAVAVSQLRSEVADLTTRVDGVTSVQMEELKRHVLHETRVASEDASQARSTIHTFDDTLKSAVARNAQLEAKLTRLLEQSEQQTALQDRRETAAAELRRDLSKLRIEVAEFAAGGSGRGADPEMKVVMFRAELQEQLAQLTREFGSRTDTMEKELQNIKRRGGGALDNIVREDFEALSRDVAGIRTETSHADTGNRERIARCERELRAEVRATQRLVLEIADQLRGSGRSAVDMPPMLALEEARGGRSPRNAASPELEMDFGAISTVADDTVEWRVPHVRARARTGDPRALVSRAFAVPRFASVPAIRLKIFPLGSKRQTQPGHCSLYLTGPKGSHLQFRLRLGHIEHGPLECFFDRAEKDTGRHDFCVLEDQLEDDGSALVRLVVMRATPGPRE